jgi:hypothetical protein
MKREKWEKREKREKKGEKKRGREKRTSSRRWGGCYFKLVHDSRQRQNEEHRIETKHKRCKGHDGSKEQSIRERCRVRAEMGKRTRRREG